MTAFFDYPRSAAFGRVVPKNRIYGHAGANTALKDLFVREVDQIVWRFKLAPETINLAATKTVTEIQVFEVTLKTGKLDEDVLRAIDKAVPFPLVFELSYGGRRKTVTTETGSLEITAPMAKQIYRYLVKNDYTDDADRIADAYHAAKEAGTLADLPEELKPHADQIFQLIDSVFSDAQLPKVEDGRKPKTNPLNANFEKKEFQELWARINRKAVYRVEFESAELVQKCISALDSQLRVTPLQYTVKIGVQQDSLTDDQLRDASGFKDLEQATIQSRSVTSVVKYDLIGKVAENAHLTRATTAAILSGMQPSVFDQFKTNPEHFLAEASRIIAEQKATMIIERLNYDQVADRYDVDIFTANQAGHDFSRASAKLKNHIYDYVVTDSDIERRFVEELDTGTEVVVYAKLPRGFLIPTPVGDYNPDWAIVFRKGGVKHIYFVAETKGTMSTMKLREIERTKIDCARKFFDEIGQRMSQDRVRYDVVTSYDKLMDIVGVVCDRDLTTTGVR
jgi:type III restriction enzyme